MIKLGITGGIGSGKSTVVDIFSLCGIPVYVADVESKRITASSSVVREQLIALLGNDLYANGILNKQLLASYIFNDPVCLKKVNAIIHPEVEKDFNQWVKKNSNHNIVLHEAAILYESGFDKLMDKVVVVYTPMEIRIQRTMTRDNVSRSLVLERIQNQLSDEEKIKLSNYIIVNDGTKSLIKQVEDIISDLKRM